MYKAMKIQLQPTAEQVKKLEEFANIARFVYNKSLDRQNLNKLQGNKYISKYEMRNRFVHLKDMLALFGETWLKNCNADVIVQAVFDCDTAFQKFFRKSDKAGYPKFKSRHTSKQSFFNDPRKLKFNGKSIMLTKIGYVRTAELIPEREYVNPRVTFDGKYWYISLGYETGAGNTSNDCEPIGIDLGLKDFAVCSNGLTVKNINKSEKVRKTEKKLKRHNRERCRRVKKGENRAKTNTKGRLIHRKLHNIRENHINQAIAKVGKAKPRTIVVENLNIQGLLLNGKLSRSISQQLWGKFLVKLEKKCEAVFIIASMSSLRVINFSKSLSVKDNLSGGVGLYISILDHASKPINTCAVLNCPTLFPFSEFINISCVSHNKEFLYFIELIFSSPNFVADT